ncbi:MAG: hypothetical protein ABUL77_00375 [Bacteroidota bacterium]
MHVTRVLDLLALLLLAALLVIPRPNVTVKAALAVPGEQRERVAQLQAHLLGVPGDVDAAIELGDLFLDGKRPDWTLATIGTVLPGHENDYRLHLRRAVAYADRFESPPAFQAVDRALALCNAPPTPGAPVCDEAPRARLHLLHSTLERIKGIDMRNNPALAKDKIYEALHPVWLPKKVTPAGKPPSTGPTK